MMKRLLKIFVSLLLMGCSNSTRAHGTIDSVLTIPVIYDEVTDFHQGAASASVSSGILYSCESSRPRKSLSTPPADPQIRMAAWEPADDGTGITTTRR